MTPGLPLTRLWTWWLIRTRAGKDTVTIIPGWQIRKQALTG